MALTAKQRERNDVISMGWTTRISLIVRSKGSGAARLASTVAAAAT